MENQIKSKYSFASLSTVLFHAKQSITKKAIEEQKIQIISKINFGGELFLREFDEIKTYKGDLFLVQPNQVIFSKINARQGCIYYHKKSFNFAVSSEYPAFNIDENRLNGDFLTMVLRSNFFKNYLQSKSTGHSKARTNVDDFLSIEIPLPLKNIQIELIESYQNCLKQAEQNEQQANQLEKDIECYLFNELGIEIKQSEQKAKNKLHFVDSKDITRWNVDFLLNPENFESTFTSKYVTSKLGQLCIGISGGTPSKQNSNYWKGDIPWVSPKDMKTDRIIETQDYITQEAINNSSAPLIQKNSLLFVVRSGILQHTVPVAINDIVVSINQDLRAFKLLDTEATTIDYIFTFFKYAQSIALKVVKHSTTVQSIDCKRLENLEIPLPPLTTQTKIVNHINQQKAEIKKLRTTANDLRLKAKQEFEAAIFD